MIKHALFAFIVLVLATASAHAVPEICGNSIDDDSDGYADESCYSGLAGMVDSPLSTAENGMVSPSTGSLYYQLPPDVAPRAPFGPSIALRRVYASLYNPGASPPAYKKPLGDRWTHNFMGWVQDNGTTLVIHMPNGQDVFASQTGASPICGTRFETRGHRATQYIDRCTSGPGSGKGYWLKTLEGATLRFDVSTKKLIEVRDTLATANKVLIAYDGNGQVSTVTDASGNKRLLMSYTSGLLSSVAFQTKSGGTFVTRHTTTYGYTSGALTSVTIGGSLAQTNVYTSSYLTQIQDAASKTIASFSYDSATAGRVARVDTTRGMVGFEFASARTGCSGSNKTVLYFNRGNTLACNADTDCGSGFLCGGKTGAGSTGQCFRAARCLTVDTTAGHHEDLVTTVAPLGPPGESCEGACTEIVFCAPAMCRFVS